jgi:hypothetical protein
LAPHNAAQALVSIAGQDASRTDADSLAPLHILEALVADFFLYIHPLCPFPHQPTFMSSFVNRDDRTNPEFLALLASMISTLVASFPRSARNHLKSQQDSPKAIVFIEKCIAVTHAARGAFWALKQPKTLNDACTSYFLALTSAYTFQMEAFREHISQAVVILKNLGFYPPKHGVSPQVGNDASTLPAEQMPFNFINDQVGKRLFWCILLGIRCVRDHTASLLRLIFTKYGLDRMPSSAQTEFPL